MNTPRTILLLFIVAFSACAEGVQVSDSGDDFASGVEIDATPVPGPPPAPVPMNRRCVDIDINAYPPCCADDEAHCIPADAIPASFQDLVSQCGAGGVCVPDQILLAENAVEFVPCNSIGDVPGACVSTCVPQVAEQAALLPREGCEDGEVCVPCISPLDNMPTGVCDPISCLPGGGMMMPEPTPPPAEPYSCENPPEEPIVDVTMFPGCCRNAHCVPLELVPAENRADFSPCPTGLCVPDSLIAYGGFSTPQTCTAIGGAEGRCFSECLPAIAAEAQRLELDVCELGERCTPCCDPRTGMPSGVCGKGCDEGPERCEPPPSCCGGGGTCLPPSVVPEDQQDTMKDCESAGLDDFLCVPNEFLDEAWVPQSCRGGEGDFAYDGVCLPDCLDLPLEFLLDATVCPNSFVCVPCRDILGRSTGAPGCP